ncbi:hypothetical protein L9F63_018575, partial [Diploptera punctata]
YKSVSSSRSMSQKYIKAMVKSSRRPSYCITTKIKMSKRHVFYILQPSCHLYQWQQVME